MTPKDHSSNVPELSVSEISHALKTTVEQAFSHVRVRGELSRITIANSGHMYADLKDENAVINAICWRGSMPNLSVKPEEGLEVVCTGRLSTYPGRSNYQLIIEQMELAGEGALLKMLEERRKKLAAEGLFDEARKKPLPYLPDVIGVVTSPTGAVIRDILHRLEDRFPRHVLVWPVRVQGEEAAGEIANAIRGFSTFDGSNGLLKPDVLIVARGGGSLEDLMAFNEEEVVRAAADCPIPLISSVGHETDTTLIDFAADKRAPTPTAAAEMAVPRRDELLATTLDLHRRMVQASAKTIDNNKTKLSGIARGLVDPKRMLEMKWQKFDSVSQSMNTYFERGLSKRKERLITVSSRLPHPKERIKSASNDLKYRTEQLSKLADTLLKPYTQKFEGSARLLETLSYKSVLDRGFAVVEGADGKLVQNPASLKTDDQISLVFRDDIRKKAKISD